jgi:HEPN domain-containing protein
MAGSSKAKPQPTRRQLQELARLRLREAKALYAADLYDGCVYLAGYAIELALKARICKLLKVNEYPTEFGSSYKVHDLDRLRLLAGLSREVDVNKNKERYDNWSTAVTWDPEQRYDAAGTYDQRTAKSILDSIESKPNGVFPWLTRVW